MQQPDKLMNNQFNDIDQRIAMAKKRLQQAGYDFRNQGGAFVVGADVPSSELTNIVEFIKPINNQDLLGHCFDRTAEAIFGGVATHAYERYYGGENVGVIPPGYHVVAGKLIDDNLTLAFDPVSRAVIFSTDDQDTAPIAQTIMFCGRNEREVTDMLSKFYGGEFQKTEIEDTPYNRISSKRN